MEKRLVYLEKKVTELLTTAKQPCSGCEALSRRVAELERRLDGPMELEDPPCDPTGVSAGPMWTAEKPDPMDLDTVDVLLQEAAQQANPVDVLLRDIVEEPDPVDALLREAERVGAGVFDDDLQELLVDDHAPPTTDFGLVVTVPGTPAPAPPASPPAADVDIQESLVDVHPLPTTDFELVVTAPETPAPAPPASPPATDAAVSRCHLILGDSIAQHIQMPVLPGDFTMNLAEGGNTWRREEKGIQHHLREWEAECSRKGAIPGSILIWMGGNDVYGRPGQRPQGLDRGAIQRVLTEAKTHGRVVMMGPTIRLWRDDGEFWEDTPAFQADLILQEMAEGVGVGFVKYVGRLMTIMRRVEGKKRHTVVGEVVSSAFSDRLGVHLSSEGYGRLMGADKVKDIFR